MTARVESPPERFARKQAERDAARVIERQRMRKKAAAEPIHPNGAVVVPALDGMYAKDGELAHLVEVIEHGCSIREAARLTGCSRATVRKAYSLIAADRARKGLPALACGCGQVATHNGCCHVRFQKSTARQQVMAALHNRQRGGLATWERES